MGQKTHPIGYRIGYNYTWSSRWYADKDYARLLHQDIKIRKMVKAKLYHAGVAKVMFQTLADRGINIQVISTSEIKVSVLIAAEYTELALRALHTAYELDAPG